MIQQFNIPVQVRMAAVGSVSAESRTAELVWSTGASVRRTDWWTGDSYIEELSLDPAHVRMGRLNGGAPLLNTHGRYSLEDVIGVVEKAWLGDGEGRAVVRFSSRSEVDPIFKDVQDGIIRNVSVGYTVHKFKDISTPEEIKARTPRLLAVDWEPAEVSLVPIGADAKAGVRAEAEKSPCEIDFLDREADPEQPDEQAKAGQAAPPAKCGGVVKLLRLRLDLLAR